MACLSSENREKSFVLSTNSSITEYSVNTSLEQSMCNTGLQIYGGAGSLSHDFKIWSITFQGIGPS